MSRPIPAGDYVEHFDPELPHHRAWLLAVLERLVGHEPQALAPFVMWRSGDDPTCCRCQASCELLPLGPFHGWHLRHCGSGAGAVWTNV